MRRLVAGAAALAVAGGLILAAEPAGALGGDVSGTFLCESSSPTFGGTSVTGTQTLLSTITVPSSTSDIASPVVATVGVTAPATGSMPASPPVALSGVVVTKFDVRLDIFTTTTNSPSGITGGPATAATGTKNVTLPVTPSTVAPRTPWSVPVAGIDVQLPAGTPGQRQWLRLKQLTYHWTASSGSVQGTTDCRLVGDMVTASGTVETPLYGFFSSLSSTWPESATNFSTGTPGTYGAFAARVTVVDATGSAPPPSSTCTVVDTTGCTTGQQVTATVIAGQLSQQANAAAGNPSSTAIVLKGPGGASAVTVATTDQTMTGPLNPVTVTDVRGGTAGWSLTAGLSGPFTEVGGGAMPTSAAKLTGVGCAPVAGSATRTTGSGGTLSSAVTLCGVDPGVDDSDGQSGGGQYTVTGAVELTVPAFQKAGEYTSTLVITLT